MERFLQIRIKNDLAYLFKEHILLSENVDESIKTIIEKLKQEYKGFDFKLERKESLINLNKYEKFRFGITHSNSIINS